MASFRVLPSSGYWLSAFAFFLGGGLMPALLPGRDCSGPKPPIPIESWPLMLVIATVCFVTCFFACYRRSRAEQVCGLAVAAFTLWMIIEFVRTSAHYS